jgi:phospholipid/cholesterol/gamma-HCH transport system substrate-binding protein
METRARHLLIGFVALAAIAVGFLFVYWMNTTGGLAQRTVYRVQFETPAAGLYRGSAVLFNGLRVGEVVGIDLDPADPRRVMARIAIDAKTPVRTDTSVGLSFQGLTGTPAIALTGGSANAPPVKAEDTEPPLLIAGAAAGQDTMQAARETLRRIDRILEDNAEPLKNAIANISTFSDALARNSDRFDKIAAGLERTFGGEAAKPLPANYSLTPPTSFPPIERLPSGPLTVVEPTALIVFDTQRILVRSDGALTPAFEDTRWADNLPIVVQAATVRTFENAGYTLAVAGEAGADPQLAIDIRDFSIGTGPDAVAKVELAAKILSGDGALVASQVFRGTAPVGGADAASSASALDIAFGKAVADLVVWALGAAE